MQELHEKQQTESKLPSVATMRGLLANCKDMPSFDKKEIKILGLINKMVNHPFPLNRAIALNELIKELSEIITYLNDINLTDPSRSKELEQLIQIQARAMLMLKSLTRTWTNIQLEILTSKDSNQWLAMQNETLRGKQLLSMRAGEQQKTTDKTLNVKYMNPEERANFQVYIDNGLLKTFEVVGKGEDSQLIFKNFDSSNMLLDSIDEYCPFVVSPEGNLYACSAPNNTAEPTIKHSSFLGGNDVCYAGSMRVVDGKVKVITNTSGHYWPPSLQTTELGILLSKADAVDRNTFFVAEQRFGGMDSVKDTASILEQRPYTIPENSTALAQSKRFKMFKNKYNALERIDGDLANFHKGKEGRSPQDNIQLLLAIITGIEAERKQPLDKVRVEQINKIEAEVTKALEYFQELLAEPEQQLKKI